MDVLHLLYCTHSETPITLTDILDLFRETTVSQASTTVLLNFRISSSSPDTTNRNLHLAHHAELTLYVSFPSWEKYEISPKSFSSQTEYLLQSKPHSFLWSERGQTTADGGEPYMQRIITCHLIIYRPNILIGFTVVAIAVSFAWLGVQDPSKWKAGVALYIIGRRFLNCLPLGSSLIWLQCSYSLSGTNRRLDSISMIHIHI